MKVVLIGSLSMVCISAYAQIPDIKFHLDATFNYRLTPDGIPLAKFYDVLGRPSTLGLSFYTEQGFRVFVTQKLQHLPGELATDLFDEYFIEDEKIWKVGKQYLPFGSGKILRDSALAARGDTNLILEGLPISVAICDSGKGLDNGVVGRMGSAFGLSLALGENFGTSGTALTSVRRPEDAPGPGHGWKEAVGLDGSHRLNSRWSVRAEGVFLRRGETALDRDTDIFEMGVSYDPKRGESTSLTFSRLQQDQSSFLRLAGSYALSKNISFEPMVRYRNSSLFDISVELRIRI